MISSMLCNSKDVTQVYSISHCATFGVDIFPHQFDENYPSKFGLFEPMNVLYLLMQFLQII